MPEASFGPISTVQPDSSSMPAERTATGIASDLILRCILPELSLQPVFRGGISHPGSLLRLPAVEAGVPAPSSSPPRFEEGRGKGFEDDAVIESLQTRPLTPSRNARGKNNLYTHGTIAGFPLRTQNSGLPRSIARRGSRPRNRHRAPGGSASRRGPGAEARGAGGPGSSAPEPEGW